MAEEKEENVYRILAHVLGLLTGFIGPLILFLSQKEKNKEHAKHALNFQLSLIIYFMAFSVLSIFSESGILLKLLFALNIVFCVFAAVRASQDKTFIYPFAIKFMYLEFLKSE